MNTDNLDPSKQVLLPVISHQTRVLMQPSDILQLISSEHYEQKVKSQLLQILEPELESVQNGFGIETGAFKIINYALKHQKLLNRIVSRLKAKDSNLMFVRDFYTQLTLQNYSVLKNDCVGTYLKDMYDNTHDMYASETFVMKLEANNINLVLLDVNGTLTDTGIETLPDKNVVDWYVKSFTTTSRHLLQILIKHSNISVAFLTTETTKDNLKLVLAQLNLTAEQIEKCTIISVNNKTWMTDDQAIQTFQSDSFLKSFLYYIKFWLNHKTRNTRSKLLHLGMIMSLYPQILPENMLFIDNERINTLASNELGIHTLTVGSKGLQPQTVYDFEFNMRLTKPSKSGKEFRDLVLALGTGDN